MANFVIKKDGTRTAFDAEKIKSGVMHAAMDAEMSNDEAGNIADQISSTIIGAYENQEEVSTTEIRDKIVSELEVSAPNVAEAWKKYEEGKGV